MTAKLHVIISLILREICKENSLFYCSSYLRNIEKMPALTITTSGVVPEGQARTEVLHALSQAVSDAIGKPINWVMVSINHTPAMMFGGDDSKPAAFCQVNSIGNINADNNRKLSSLVCAILQEKLAVPSDRVFIQFYESTVGIAKFITDYLMKIILILGST